MDYITTATTEWVSNVFLEMSDMELSEELTALKKSLDNYFQGSTNLANSFVCEYLGDMYDIARDVLVFRFTEIHVPDNAENSGA